MNTNYIVRFHLDNGTNYHYTFLKRLLLKAGFTKIIKSDSGVQYILPSGTYLATTDKDKNQVLDIATNVVKRIGLNYSVLVTQSAGSAWINLPLA